MSGFLGLGFLFGARDDGLTSSLNRYEGSLGGINKLLRTQSDIAKSSKVGNLLQGLGNLSLNRLVDGLEDASRNTGDLTTSLEATFVQMDKSVSPIIAKLGLTGEAARKAKGQITSMAYGMNVDVGTVATAFTALEEGGEGVRKTMKAMGMDLKTLVKIQEVTGVESTALVETVNDLTKSWKFSDAQAKDLLDSLVGLGQEAGVGSLGLGKMLEITAAMDKQMAELGTSFQKTPDEIATIEKSVVKLAGAFREGVGSSAESAMSDAMALFTKITEEQVTVNKMGRGQADQWGGMAQSLAELSGSADWAMKMINSDPISFMKEINEKFKDIETTGTEAQKLSFNRLRQELTAVSPAAVYLATNVTTGTDALNKFAAASPKTEGALKRLATGFKSGITLQESLDRAQEGFMIRVRSIGKSYVKDFVGAQIKGYKQFGDSLIDMGKDETWGPILKRLSAMTQLGWKALLPMSRLGQTLGVTGDMVMTAATALQPLAVSLTAIMPILGKLGIMVAGLVTGLASVVGWPALIAAALIGGVVLIAKYWPEIRDALIKGMTWVFSKAVDYSAWVSSIDPQALADSIEKQIMGGIGSLVDMVSGKSSGPLGDAARALLSGLVTAVKVTRNLASTLAPILYSKLTAAMDAIPWGALWDRMKANAPVLLQGMADAWDFIRSSTPIIRAKINDALTMAWTTLKAWAPVAMQAINDEIAAIDWAGVAHGVQSGLRKVWDFVSNNWGALLDVAAIATGPVGILWGTLAQIPDSLASDIGNTLWSFLKDNWQSIASWALSAVSGTIVWKWLLAVPDGTKDYIKGEASKALDYLTDALTGAASSVASTVWDTLTGAFDAVVGFYKGDKSGLINSIFGTVDDIRQSVEDWVVGLDIGGVLMGALGSADEMLTGFEGWVDALDFDAMMEGLLAGFESAMDSIFGGADSVKDGGGDFVSDMFDVMVSTIANFDWKKAAETVFNLYTVIIRAIQGIDWIGVVAGMFKAGELVLRIQMAFGKILFKAFSTLIRLIPDVMNASAGLLWKIIKFAFNAQMDLTLWITGKIYDYVIKPIIDTLANAGSAVAEAVKQMAYSLQENLDAAWSDPLGWADKMIVEPISNAIQWIEGLGERVKTAVGVYVVEPIKAMASDLVKTGEFMVDKITDGFRRNWDTFIGFLKKKVGMASSLFDFEGMKMDKGASTDFSKPGSVYDEGKGQTASLGTAGGFQTVSFTSPYANRPDSTLTADHAPLWVTNDTSGNTGLDRESRDATLIVKTDIQHLTAVITSTAQRTVGLLEEISINTLRTARALETSGAAPMRRANAARTEGI